VEVVVLAVQSRRACSGMTLFVSVCVRARVMRGAVFRVCVSGMRVVTVLSATDEGAEAAPPSPPVPALPVPACPHVPVC
jgi:hypothetical protein